jgi:predicted nucleic-acid-binding protein
MLGLDTNVLVRYVVRNNEAQFERARRSIRRTAAAEGVFVSLLVLQETEWVLRSRYDLSKAEIIETISALLDTTEVRFEDEPTIEGAQTIGQAALGRRLTAVTNPEMRRLV